MKKIAVTLILIFTIITTQSISAFAYSPATRNGQIWETESNDYLEDATIFYEQASTIYPINGGIRYIEDQDYFVYQCKVTKTRNLRLGYSSNLNVSGATAFFYVLDLTDDNLIFAQSVPTVNGVNVRLNAIKGHEYIISVSLEGPVDEIQDRLDFLGSQNNDIGWRYVLSMSPNT
jgi:hypothetical protein